MSPIRLADISYESPTPLAGGPFRTENLVAPAPPAPAAPIFGSGTRAPLRWAAVEAGKWGRASRCRSCRDLRLTCYFRTRSPHVAWELPAPGLSGRRRSRWIQRCGRLERISQSAVSHAIATLERATGTPVLTRRGTPRPTFFGERIGTTSIRTTLRPVTPTSHSTPKNLTVLAVHNIYFSSDSVRVTYCISVRVRDCTLMTPKPRGCRSRTLCTNATTMTTNLTVPLAVSGSRSSRFGACDRSGPPREPSG
jgi:hypothetical protein